MENKRIFRDGQDLDPADFNLLQDYAQSSIDHVVADGISADRKYAGFAAAASSNQEVTVQPGRLYSGGKVYLRDAAFTKNFTTILPIATKKVVLVVVFGTEQDTEETPREFLTNEETGASEPQTVAMRHARVCQINTATGVEAPDPLDPIVDAGLLPVARIVLSPTGIQSVTMLTDNRLVAAADVDAKVGALQDFRDRTGPAIETLSSDLAGLKAGIVNNVNQVAFGRALVRLATIESKVGIPSNATNSAADYLLDASTSDVTNPSFLAKVAEGIRFADNAAATSQLALLNPLNPLAKMAGDVLFPAYTHELRLGVGPRTSEVRASAYTYANHQMVQRTMSRVRIRYGEEFTVCTNAGWWGAITSQYVPATFSHDGETFETVSVDWDGPTHGWVRVRRYWEDVYEEPYWDYVTIDQAVPGAQVAETFLNSNDMWLGRVGLTFTRLAAAGDGVLAICETDRGMPDLSKVISRTTITRAAMVTNSETVTEIQPVFLKGGTRYAIVFITAADHWLGTTDGVNFAQGTFFYVLDGAYQQGDATRDLCFSLYAAKFAASRAVIDLGALQLAGGIASIDILAESIRPGSTDLTFEVQVGGVWYPLAKADQSILGAGGNIPPLVPLRAVFTGTPDAMPCVKLAGSTVRVSCPRTTLTHISLARTLPSPSSSIRVIVRLEAFDAAHHTATVKLRTGAGFTTLVAASAFTDVVAGDGAIERTFVFNLGAAISSFKVQCEATTDSALRTFHFAWRKDYAL